MIDVHAHAVLEGTLGCAGHYGPELGTGPEGRPRFRVGGYVLDGINCVKNIALISLTGSTQNAVLAMPPQPNVPLGQATRVLA